MALLRRLSWLCMLVLPACSTAETSDQVRNMSIGAEQFREAFNQSQGAARLVLVFSPT